MRAADLKVDGIAWRPNSRAEMVLHPTSFGLREGRVLGVVGPNGAGKTTLLRMLYRYHQPSAGSVRIDGENIWDLPARAVAKKVAAVLQEQPTDFALTVDEIVRLGRTPHRTSFATNTLARDNDVIHHALDILGLHDMAHRYFGTLSGGERQRVMVARALAQEPRLLILDEPTNHLDIHHQLEVLDLIRSLPLTIVTSLHDLNLAAGICEDILLLMNGKPLGFGPPQKVLSENAVSCAFNVMARREQLSISQTDHLTFHRYEERVSQ
ncbi:MAG: ABC transporter ATP-binding protein [Tateyamaria sp.]|uniref:ABC transporter ATP-binding protein n=1 Tax=Tateyamaria sp. TaxID=1929288 RepID=UPI0032935FE5